ncbi:MAG: hypothetical protein A2W99_09635 [Bacteroidetes bacterium GWF2_33_16]|nr:MAG: hypothetical protein A2X00_06545 [Bacteroidetes bacterium GWE2_32_14]OFY07254.1 MAG: hypothetical protein A2W99_09635 [Bacteroidetes bacterium GWF2_33_16]
MKKLISIILFIFLIHDFSAFSQETETKESKFNFTIGSDFVSRYVWRGTDFGRSPSIQPGIELSTGGFAIGYWGAFATSQITSGSFAATQETDLYLSYTFNDLLSFTITDYFFPNDTLFNNNYYEFNEDKTGHIAEVSLSFNGTEKIPFTLLVATNIWGADKRKTNGDKFYSTYVELGYSKTILSDISLNAFLGVNVIAPDLDKGESGFYGDYMGVVNLGITGTKEIKVTDNFSVPFAVSVITNPQTQNIFMVLGISL